MNRKIILARPNQFIVEHMKHLVNDLGCDPMPITSFQDIQKLPKESIAAFVISTSVTSVVRKGYLDVLQEILTNYPDKPIFLATLGTIDQLKRVVDRKLEAWNINREMVGIDSISGSNHNVLLAIQKKDLVNEVSYQKVVNYVSNQIN